MVKEMNQLTKEKQKELLKIQKRNSGFLRPESVVKAAASPNSVLHDSFDWDDSVAGHHWRLEQARRLIRMAVIVLDSSDEPTRMFVSFKDERNETEGYRSIVDVLSDKDLTRKMLQEALSDLKSIQRKYKNLEELSQLKNVVDLLEARLSKSVQE